MQKKTPNKKPVPKPKKATAVDASKRLLQSLSDKVKALTKTSPNKPDPKLLHRRLLEAFALRPSIFTRPPTPSRSVRSSDPSNVIVHKIGCHYTNRWTYGTNMLFMTSKNRVPVMRGHMDQVAPNDFDPTTNFGSNYNGNVSTGLYYEASWDTEHGFGYSMADPNSLVLGGTQGAIFYQMAGGIFHFSITNESPDLTLQVGILDPSAGNKLYSVFGGSAIDGTPEDTEATDTCWVTSQAITQPMVVDAAASTLTLAPGATAWVVLKACSLKPTDWYRVQTDLEADQPNTPGAEYQGRSVRSHLSTGQMGFFVDTGDTIYPGTTHRYSVSMRGEYSLAHRSLTRDPAHRGYHVPTLTLDEEPIGERLYPAPGLSTTEQGAVLDSHNREISSIVSRGKDPSLALAVAQVPAVPQSRVGCMLQSASSFVSHDSSMLKTGAVLATAVGLAGTAYATLTDEQKSKIAKTARDLTSGTGELADSVGNLAGTLGKGLNLANGAINSAADSVSRLWKTLNL